MAKMLKYGISLTFTVAVVTNMATKIGWKWESDHFGTNLRQLTDKKLL